ncbi:MAG: hypothetical protein IPH04_11690 [Saprospirales bacterium]|nr:hypothetical protein [Saprospirales bacterium]
MKTSLYFLFLALSFSLLSSSCKKEEEAVAMTEEEAVEVIESSMSAEAQGMAGEASDVAEAAESFADESLCGMTGDSSLSYTIDQVNLQASYTIAWGWELVCTGFIPNTLEFVRTTDGTYETNRLKSDDSAISSWDITNLVTGTQYIMNGSYTREGSQESKIGQQNEFSSTLVITATDILVDKVTQEIAGGTASFTLTGNGSGGSDVSYTGTIVFNGNQSATLTINGNSHPLNW